MGRVTARESISSGRRGAAIGTRAFLIRRVVQGASVDRRLANRNLRTALVAGAIALLVFALSFLVGLIY